MVSKNDTLYTEVIAPNKSGQISSFQFCHLKLFRFFEKNLYKR
jgi:hypothetical protein